MGDWNIEHLRAKDARRSPAPDVAPPSPPKKARRQWRVMHGESVMYRAATREQCEAWIEKKKRSGSTGLWRGVAQNLKEADTIRRQARAAGFRIVGPGEPRPGKPDLSTAEILTAISKTGDAT